VLRVGPSPTCEHSIVAFVFVSLVGAGAARVRLVSLRGGRAGAGILTAQHRRGSSQGRPPWSVVRPSTEAADAFLASLVYGYGYRRSPHSALRYGQWWSSEGRRDGRQTRPGVYRLHPNT
jgi:hypothetical protein